MFSKKHYVAIAEVLQKEIKKAENLDLSLNKDGINSNTKDGVKKVIDSCVNLFKNDNPKFKTDKFIDKCYGIYLTKKGA